MSSFSGAESPLAEFRLLLVHERSVCGEVGAEVYISRRPQQRIEGHLASSSELQTPRRALSFPGHIRRPTAGYSEDARKILSLRTQGNSNCPSPNESGARTTIPILPAPATTTRNRQYARSQRNAAPATSRPGPQLRARPLYSLHALERLVNSQRFTITDCCRPVWIHGTRVPEGRSIVPVEQGNGHTGWGDCGVQREGQGYPDCASCGPAIWRRVSRAFRWEVGRMEKEGV